MTVISVHKERNVLMVITIVYKSLLPGWFSANKANTEYGKKTIIDIGTVDFLKKGSFSVVFLSYHLNAINMHTKIY